MNFLFTLLIVLSSSLVKASPTCEFFFKRNDIFGSIAISESYVSSKKILPSLDEIIVQLYFEPSANRTAILTDLLKESKTIFVSSDFLNETTNQKLFHLIHRSFELIESLQNGVLKNEFDININLWSLNEFSMAARNLLLPMRNQGLSLENIRSLYRSYLDWMYRDTSPLTRRANVEKREKAMQVFEQQLLRMN